MQVEVRLFASLRPYGPQGANAPFSFELPEGARVRDLVAALGLPAAIPKLVFVNGLQSAEEAELHQGDRVGLFPPVAGG